MKDETGGVAIKRFVELKPKRCIHSWQMNGEYKNVWEIQWIEFKVKIKE